MQLIETLQSPAAVVAGVRDSLVAGLGSVLWAAQESAQLLDVVAELERLRSAVAAVALEVAVEVEAGEHARTAGWASPGDYLTAVAGGRHGAGGRMLRTGRALCSDREVTGRALAAGEVSPEQAEVIVAAISRLPVDPDLRAAAERLLLEHAAHLNASELKVAGQALWERLDPDGHARAEEAKLRKQERSAHLDRFLSIVDDGLGGVAVKGRGTVEDAAVLKAALAALAAPAAKDLQGSDPEHGTGGRDVRDAGARHWDALVDLAQRALDTGVLPTDHGRKPQVVVTIDEHDLRDRVGVGTLPTGERLSAAAVRKLACDAQILPIVLGSDGVPLDVGRAQRLVTPAIWSAVVARDRHCRFPGCRRPPIACDAHHIVHWADGGATALDNLVLLCRVHHTIIHSTPWQVRISRVDGHPEFRPPPDLRPSARFRTQVETRAGYVGHARPRPGSPGDPGYVGGAGYLRDRGDPDGGGDPGGGGNPGGPAGARDVDREDGWIRERRPRD